MVRDDGDRLSFARTPGGLGLRDPCFEADRVVPWKAAASLTAHLNPTAPKSLTTTGDAQAKRAVQARALNTVKQRNMWASRILLGADQCSKNRNNDGDCMRWLVV